MEYSLYAAWAARSGPRVNRHGGPQPDPPGRETMWWVSLVQNTVNDLRPAGLGLIAPIWKPLLDASGLLACACLFSTKEKTGTLHPLAPAWPWSSWLTSCEPREVHLALISLVLRSQPDVAVLEEAPCRPPREAWPLARVLGLRR